MKVKVASKGSRGEPEQSRKAILQAASLAFANEGYAGARTDAMAEAAGVNKALLYYYFHDKEGLYGAVLDYNFGGLLGELVGILDSDSPPGRKILTYAATHFDYLATHPHYRRLVQHEMMRAGAGQSAHFRRLVGTFFRPLLERLVGTLNKGIASGEFRQVNTLHFVNSMIAVVVFYFTSAPLIREMSGRDPLSAESLANRREAMLDFLSGALFASHARAAEVKGEVLGSVHRHAKGRRS